MQSCIGSYLFAQDTAYKSLVVAVRIGVWQVFFCVRVAFDLKPVLFCSVEGSKYLPQKSKDFKKEIFTKNPQSTYRE